MAETREACNCRCHRERSGGEVGSLFLCHNLEASERKALAGVKPNELRPMGAVAISCLRKNRGDIGLVNFTLP